MADELRGRLERMARDATSPEDRAWAAGKLREKYGNETHALPIGDAQKAKIERETAAGQTSAPNPSLLDELGRGVSDAASTAGAFGADANDSFFGGIPGKLLDLAHLSTPQERQALKAQHPDAALLGKAFGTVASAANPFGPEAALGNSAQGLVGMLEQRVPAMATSAVGRIVGQAGAGAATGYGIGAADTLTRGGSLRDAHEAGKSGAALGASMGGGAQAAGEGAGALASGIRNSDTTTGDHIRLLESDGASPSPMPFSPVDNAPSKRLGVRATAAGRGEVGELAGRRMQDEVSALERGNKAKSREEIGGSLDRQGDRQISVESMIDRVHAEMAKPSAQMNPTVMQGLKNTLGILEGRIEPSAEIYTVTPQTQRGSVGGVEETLPEPITIHTAPTQASGGGSAPTEIAPGVARRVRVKLNNGDAHSDSPTYRDNVLVQPRRESVGTRQYGGTVTAGGEEPIVVSKVERPGFETTATSAEAGEPAVVGMGDIRGRKGDAPNRYMTARDLNELRDKLDEAAGMASRETGTSKQQFPFHSLAQEIRHGIMPAEAPGIALANRRAASRMRKVELTQDRMKTGDSESLGMQIASLGEEGSKTAGARKVRLEELQRQFPNTPGMSRLELDQLMKNPRLLMAEERMHAKELSSLIPGVKDVLNLGEPFVARGVYAPANAAAPRLKMLARSLPSWINPIEYAYAQALEAMGQRKGDKQ